MTIKIIQYYTSNLQYAITSEKINKEYCDKYGFEYFSQTDNDTIRNTSDNRAVQWYKIKFIQQQLEESNVDYIMFMDADAIFVKPEVDIRTIIEDYLDKELIISEDFGPDIVNTGVMIFKNTNWSVDFLKRIWEGGNKISRGKYRTDIWHEQTIVSAYLYVNDNDRDKTVILSPLDFNSINDNILRQDKTFIYHDLSKQRIDEIYKISLGEYDVITKLNIACESDRQVNHKFGTYYRNLIEELLKTKNDITILDIGGDKGVIFNILLQYYPELNYINISDLTYDTSNNKITNIKLDGINSETLDDFIRKNNIEYDIIIADYLHKCYYRDLLFSKFFNKLKPNGYFIIEDLQTDKEINIPEKNSLYGWGDPNKKSMTQLIKQFNIDGTFNSDYFDFKDLNKQILTTNIYTTEVGSELGVIIKK
jgi:SAM-dependent methyltransferase